MFLLNCTTDIVCWNVFIWPQWQRRSHQWQTIWYIHSVGSAPSLAFAYAILLYYCFCWKTLHAVIHSACIRLLLLQLNFMVQIYTLNRVGHTYMYTFVCLLLVAIILFFLHSLSLSISVLLFSFSSIFFWHHFRPAILSSCII